MSCAHSTRSKLLLTRPVCWEGERIVRPAVVQAFRPIPDAPRGKRTDVDIRSFVPSRASAVLSERVDTLLRHSEAAGELPPGSLTLPEDGAFDLRAVLVVRFVAEQIRYTTREGKYFQLPEETLARGAGDCEDRAILLAAMLIAAGISPYNVRVALGEVRYGGPQGLAQTAAHAWVAYKDEVGSWLLLDPPAKAPSRARRGTPDTFSYDPAFLFNGDHLWYARTGEHVPSPEELKVRWNELDPRFHGDVHRSIIDEAFEKSPALAAQPLLKSLLRHKFAVVFGQVIDAPDLSLSGYTPADHFDNGLVDAGWRRVEQRLATFYGAGLTSPQGVNALCFAIHAISDFYAHSSFAHFAAGQGLPPSPYSPAIAKTLKLDYAADPAFAKLAARYSPNRTWFAGSSAEALALWKGRLISGRYSQPGDGRSFIEKVTHGVTDVVPKERRPFTGSLPHHDDIAVDEAGEHTNLLYPRATAYKAQFAWRRAAAVQHVAQAIAGHRALRASAPGRGPGH
jgi:Transglutaminase-like superfamily